MSADADAADAADADELTVSLSTLASFARQIPDEWAEEDRTSSVVSSSSATEAFPLLSSAVGSRTDGAARDAARTTTPRRRRRSSGRCAFGRTRSRTFAAGRRAAPSLAEPPDGAERRRRSIVQTSLATVASALGAEEEDGRTLLAPSLATALTINLVSIGYLSLPWAFARSGPWLATIGLGAVVLTSFVTSQYVLAALARACFLADAEAERRATRKHSLGPEAARAWSERFGTVQNDDDEDEEGAKEEEEPHELGVGFKAELPSLCHAFLGPRSRPFFLACLALDIYGATWSFASVFANGLAETIPLPWTADSGYRLYLAAFAAAVVPLSCAELGDSVVLQLAFLLGRIVMVLLMIATVASSWASGTSHFDDRGGVDVGPVGGPTGVPRPGLSSLYLVLQIAIFSTSFQFAVPGVADASGDKRSMARVFGTTCWFVFATVLLLSLVLSAYFGIERTEPSSNLNWGGYHGGTGAAVVDDDGAISRRGIANWARAISCYVTMFPVVDSIAVFPLCAISLGEIVMEAWYHDKTATPGWEQRTAFRLLGCCPQILGAAVVADLSTIAKYAGLFTTISYLVCPSLLYIYSGRVLRKLGFPEDTYYKTPFSRDWVAWTICIGAATVIVSIFVGAMQT